MAELLGSVNGEYFCRPRAANNEEIVRVVIKYMNEHPNQLHLLAATLIFAALKEGFPCPNADTPPK
jgi:hypothetical protein